ncbi:MAG: flagellar motor protein MotB [Planctomycetota bacterium]
MEAEDDGPPGVPEWVVTYGDMMSLLLTFFIMLVSMSELKEEGKVRAILEVFQQRFGPTDALASAPGESPLDRNDQKTATASGRRRQGGVSQERADAREQVGAFNGAAESPLDQRPALAGPAAFGRFGAEVGPGMRRTLDSIAKAVARAGGEVIVRGHASPEPLPVDSPHEDAWDLARARAEAVAAELIARGIEPDRIRIEAAGATQPPATAPGSAALDDSRAWDRVDVLLAEN